MANNNHFLLTLDTLAPTGSISAPRYFKENGKVTIVTGDAQKMYVWFDDKDAGVREDAPAAFIDAATEITSAFEADGNFYYHLVLVDDVGNESEVYNTEMITFDKTAPIVNSVSVKDGASFTTSHMVPVKVVFEDALSGVVTVQLTGDITAVTHSLTAAEIEAGEVTLDVTLNALTETEGEEGAVRTVIATVTDAAGNVSVSKEDSIEYDPVEPEAALYLKTADGSANLPGIVNNTEFMAQISIDVAHEDVVGYKIWEDPNGANEPVSYTTIEAGTTPIEVVMNCTTGDGEKVINAKIIDRAGNEKVLAPKSFVLAQTVGTATIVSDKAYISKIEGFTTATISTTVVEGSATTKSWRLLSGNEEVKAGTGAVPATIVITTSDSPFTAEGAHELKLEVTDVATSVVVSDPITVTSDFTGPVASTIATDAWYNKTAGFVASAADDTAGMAYMQAWISNKANDEEAKGTEIAYAATNAADVDKFDWSGATQSDENYAHIKYTDAVGNVTYAHSAAFGYDTVAPELPIITLPETSSTVSSKATISYNDPTSGVAQMKIWGDITEAATEVDAQWVTAGTAYSITFIEGDGNKVVYVKVKDVAGNESVAAESNPCELDTTIPSATLVLRTADDSAQLPNFTAVPKIAVHVSGGDDIEEGKAIQYLLYGDFSYGAQGAQGVTEAAAVWTDLVYVDGQAYMVVTDMFLTEGEGNKNIYLKVKDNAGNISPEPEPIVTKAAQVVYYDPSAPEVVVSGVDYNRISKMHTARHDNAAKFNDETHFVFTPSEAIQAYKVVAYADQAAAEAGSDADAVIPSDAGSVNMSATGLSSADAVNAMIRGADLESAVPGDGIKIVVVYVQDLAGTWSVAAQFAV